MEVEDETGMAKEIRARRVLMCEELMGSRSSGKLGGRQSAMAPIDSTGKKTQVWGVGKIGPSFVLSRVVNPFRLVPVTSQLS